MTNRSSEELAKFLGGRSKSHVLLLVGAPGSGKSEFAKMMLENGYVVISTDSIRGELTGDPGSQKCNPWLLAFERLEAAIEANEKVIFDATNCISSSRAEFVRKCQEIGGYNFDVCAVYFKAPLGLCLQRNKRRERVVPEGVIRRMMAHLHRPPLTPEQARLEGFTELLIITPAAES